MSLLSGARNAKNGELAKQQSEIIRRRFPSANDALASMSVLVGNTLASLGEFQEASDIRLTMAQSGWKKKSGLSWTEVNGEIAVGEWILPSVPLQEELLSRNFVCMIDLIRDKRKSMPNAIDC